jgi:ABC-2 type transport system ATP-binding protein
MRPRRTPPEATIAMKPAFEAAASSRRVATARAPWMTLLPSLPAIEARQLVRSFGAHVALRQAALSVQRGEIHALLGPNGAGKTTLLRILAGLTTPTEGEVWVMGQDASRARRSLRAQIGLVPSGDRTLYLRLSGLENLAFFARLHGMRRRQAVARAERLLAYVGLSDAAGRPVGTYSHGMQKRLSVARGLLMSPPVLLVDEATHDLDPQAAAEVRRLVANLALSGTAVVWATQRIDEIRGFADRVTLLGDGEVRFTGSVDDLIATTDPRTFVLQLRHNGLGDATRRVSRIVADDWTIARLGPGDGEAEHYLLSLDDGSVLGDAISAIQAGGMSVVACHRERSEIEEAFVTLSGNGAR